MSITSDEVNYLIWRYLLESGFQHSTFAFQYETAIHRQEFKNSNVKPGMLISLLQKGLQFLQVETHLNPDGTEIKCAAPFVLMREHKCEIVQPTEEETALEKKALDKLKTRQEKKRKAQERHEKRQRQQSLEEQIMFEPRVFEGHLNEVFVVGWNPLHDLVATGSGDGTCRIWTIPAAGEEASEPLVLQHTTGEKKDVTTLEWSPDGQFLATGSYDGIGRVWTKLGKPVLKLVKHEGPIFCLKYSRRGDLIATGSVDKTAIIWDATTGEARQQFLFHSGPVLDLAWRDESTLATSSADHRIFVCQLGSLEPLVQFVGHTSEVNAIRWDNSGKYLASCSDDKTAKVWTIDSEKPLLSLTDHSREVYMTRWCPADDDRLLLATAAFDGTIKIWDINRDGECIHTLKGHKDAIYSVTFHPDTNHLASGSADRSVYIWSLRDGNLVASYPGSASVYEVQFNNAGDKLAACTSDNKLVVLYVDELKIAQAQYTAEG
ncbi:WD40-repeat-containing domain protein [Gorgonomyces haynaldii]|nr:WD40-repeat-containing domain protein [Gorgonomyces haynaldii]